MAKILNLEGLLDAIKTASEKEETNDEGTTFPGVPEALVMELRERGKAYIEALAKVPYQVGDLVTVKPGTNTKG